MRLSPKKFNSNFQCPFTQIFRPRCYTKFCLCFTAILSCLPICCWNVDMSGLRTAIYRKILYNSGFLGGKNGLLRCNFEQLLVVIRAFGGWLMHFYDFHWGVLRFFCWRESGNCRVYCNRITLRIAVWRCFGAILCCFCLSILCERRFCLGFMILGVVGLRCVGVLACLGFFGACCGLFGWSLVGCSLWGEDLNWAVIIAGFGSRNGKICRAFRGRLLFRHVVRVLGLENI